LQREKQPAVGLCFTLQINSVEPPEVPSMEHHKQPSRKTDRGQASSAESAPAIHAAPIQPGAAARIWALPTLSGGVWPVWEETRIDEVARLLESERPAVLCQPGSDERQTLSAAHTATARALRARGQDALFSFLQRMVISGALLLAGVLAWRVPGELRVLDSLFLLGGLGYAAYVCARPAPTRCAGTTTRWTRAGCWRAAKRFLQTCVSGWRKLCACARLCRATSAGSRLTPSCWTPTPTAS
jgi:hypothetical protein